MSRNNRRVVGLWLPAIIGLVLLAAGIRYVRSRGWLPNLGGDREPTYQTISSGASLQVFAPAVPTVPATTPETGTNEGNTGTAPGSDPPKRMW